MEEDYKARMAESQQEIEEMKKTWEEKLAAAAASGVRKKPEFFFILGNKIFCAALGNYSLLLIPPKGTIPQNRSNVYRLLT